MDRKGYKVNLTIALFFVCCVCVREFFFLVGGVLATRITRLGFMTRQGASEHSM